MLFSFAVLLLLPPPLHMLLLSPPRARARSQHCWKPRPLGRRSDVEVAAKKVECWAGTPGRGASHRDFENLEEQTSEVEVRAPRTCLLVYGYSASVRCCCCCCDAERWDGPSAACCRVWSSAAVAVARSAAAAGGSWGSTVRLLGTSAGPLAGAGWTAGA